MALFVIMGIEDIDLKKLCFFCSLFFPFFVFLATSVSSHVDWSLLRGMIIKTSVCSLAVILLHFIAGCHFCIKASCHFCCCLAPSLLKIKCPLLNESLLASLAPPSAYYAVINKALCQCCSLARMNRGSYLGNTSP